MARFRLLFAALFLLGRAFAADAVYPGRSWETIPAPEAAGWSATKLRAAEEFSRSSNSAAVMVVFQGRVLAQWGETTRRFMCHSIRKSFLSALYGIHVQEGRVRRIQLSRTLGDLGIDDNEPSLTPEEKKATVLDLLKARSGVYHPALYETPAMRAARPPRGSHAPGTFWYYNNWDFNVLGTIFEQQTGAKIFEDLQRRIAAPLEMEDFRLEDTEYFRGPDSIHPAYPIRMSARDLARFGYLFLRQGKWKDRQIVPQKWTRASVASYSDAGPSGGYGYMWWVAAGGRHLPEVTLPDGAYSARGAGGHYILVIPRMNLVIVHRANTDEGPAVPAAAFGKLVRLILDARL